MGCAVHIIENGCVEVIRDLAIHLNAVCRVASTTQKLVDRKANLSEMDLEVLLYAEESRRADVL